MIVVHHLENSRSLRVLWMLEELGLMYELRQYARDPRTLLAPAELRKVHALGKAPILQDGDRVLAESGAILEYLADMHDPQRALSPPLLPADGDERMAYRYWMHYAEGSLMNWMVMKLVFLTIPTQPMPFFVRPVARLLCSAVQAKLIDPNISTALGFIEEHLSKNTWFAGEHLSMADFQMSFGVEAALSRNKNLSAYPRLQAYGARLRARPAYQRAIQKGGPVMM